MIVRIDNKYPDMDQIDVIVGPSEDVHVIISRDEDGEVYVQVVNNATSVDHSLTLGKGEDG
jgi:hypothetical protein